MKIDLRELEDGAIELRGEAGPGFIELESAGAKPRGSLSYRLTACRGEAGGIQVFGSLRLEVELECVCCLEPFPFLLELDSFELAIPASELPQGHLLDLTPSIREDILLNLPAYPKCDWAGQTACPARFASTDTAPAGGFPQGSDAWSALDALSGRTRPNPTQTSN